MIAKDERDVAADFGRLFGQDKRVERRAQPQATGTLLAADENVEPKLRLAVDCCQCRHKADILRFGWQQFSRQPVMVTLSFRGRLVNSLLPRIRSVKASAAGEASNSSLRNTGRGAAAHATNIVHAGLQRGQADGEHPPPDSITSPIVNHRI